MTTPAIREQLTTKHGEISAQMTALRVAPIRLDEAATQAAILHNEQTLLAEIEQALERLDAGLYGRCVDCKPGEDAIPEARLAAKPWAIRCIKHEQAQEEKLRRQLAKKPFDAATALGISALTGPIPLEPVARLDADIKQATGQMTQEGARPLVSLYYTVQENRIRFANQVRAMSEAATPHNLVRWMLGSVEGLEDNIKKTLDAYSASQVVGRWMRSVPGIGPVLASGFLAHIDIAKAPTAGHIWTYAGLNPESEWLGNERARQLVHDVLADLHAREVDEDVLVEAAHRAHRNPTRLRAQAATEAGTITVASLSAALAKRPWNAELKRLCVRPDQRVLTHRGHIPIADVQVGDRVLTHNGRWRKVIEVLCRDYAGPLIGLRAHGHGSQVAWLTGNHPVYTKRLLGYHYQDAQRQTVRWRKRPTMPDQLLAKGSDEVIAVMRSMRAAGATLATIAEKYGYSQAGVSLIVRNLNRTAPRTINETIGWEPAEAITSGSSRLFVPRCIEHDETFVLEMSRDGMIERENTLIAEGQYPGVPHVRSRAIPGSLPLTAQVGRLIGLYVAEGHTSGNALGFSFHEREVDYHTFICETISSLTGLACHITHNQANHCKQLIIRSKCLATTFKTLFGANCYEKRLPPEWLHASLDVLASIVRGAFEGDGHFDEKQISLGSVSRDLVYWLKEALNALQIRSAISFGSHSYSLYVYDMKRFRSIVLGEGAKELSQDRHWEPSGIWLTAQTSYCEQYEGPVYNLEVEEDHSYVVEGFAVHNCFLAGESFVKVQSRPRDIYGKVFVERKRLEQEANEYLYYAEQAESILREKRIGKETDAYAWYSQGKLPPAHIHARARRYAVKLYISHLQAVWYEIEYGMKPPFPYVLTHMGHVHYTKPPFWPLDERAEWQGDDAVDVIAPDAWEDEGGAVETVFATGAAAGTPPQKPIPPSLAEKLARFKGQISTR